MAEEFCGKCYNAAGRLEARIAELEAFARFALNAGIAESARQRCAGQDDVAWCKIVDQATALLPGNA